MSDKHESIMHEIADSLLDYFDEVGAVNYIEQIFECKEDSSKSFVLTMQKTEGLTPCEKLNIANEQIEKLQAEITKIRQGEKDMRDTITLYDKAITRIAHHIQDQGNAKHFCTSGIDFDGGTAKEICDYITKINEELERK